MSNATVAAFGWDTARRHRLLWATWRRFDPSSSPSATNINQAIDRDVTKVFGFWIALAGTFMAGRLIPRIGMMASLLIGTVAGPASHLALALLAAHGGDGGKAFRTFALAFGIDGFTYAFASISHHLHVDARISGLRGEPVRSIDLTLRFSGSILAGFSGSAQVATFGSGSRTAI